MRKKWKKEAEERERKLRRLARTFTALGLDLAMGKVEPDQAAKWLRVLSLHIQMPREAMIWSATWTWFEAESKSLREYMESKGFYDD